MENLEKLGQASEKEIASLKERFGEIWEFEVDGRYCYMKKPDRSVLAAAMANGQKNPIKFNETLVNNCFVHGYAGFKTDDNLFLAVSQELSELIETKVATVKKL